MAGEYEHSSPLEHGELEESPSHSPGYSPTNTPEIVIGVASEDHSDGDQESPNSNRYPDEEELGPDIKPPQAKVKRDKHKSHKHEKHKSRDKSDRHADKRAERGEGKRTVSTISRRDARDRGAGRNERRGEINVQIERDRQNRAYEEQTHRERSNRERERLERLEMERQRLDREISRREQQHREKLEREKKEREQKERDIRQRSRVVVVKNTDDDRRRTNTRQVVESRREQVRSNIPRSRSPQTRRDEVQANNRSKDRGQRQKSDAAYGERSRQSQYPPSRKSDPEGSRSRLVSKQSVEKRSREEKKKIVEQLDISSEKEEEDVEISEESDSASDSSSSEDSESGGSESSSEGEENKENAKSANGAQSVGRVKSRFDSESAPEDVPSDHRSEQSDRESEHHSEASGDYNDYLDETPPQSPVELLPDLPPYYPAIQGCRNVDEFNCLYRIEEGTYGVVYQALDKKTDEVVALKRLKMEKEKEGFPITSLREINTLLKAQHPNIVTVREIVVGSNMDRIYIVMDYVEHDLKSLMEYRMKTPFTVGEVKTLVIQLLRGVAHLHDNWIIHRDLKTSNLLLSHAGILKIADFGLAREYGSPLKPYTPIVVTLWYRAPELLLGTKEYSCPIDLWSVGCIMAEFLTKKPLFPGKSEIDELNRIFKELGTPNEKIWTGVSELKGWKTCTFADYPYNQLRNRFGGLLTEKGFELLNRFLTYNPAKRVTAVEALKHPWFHSEGPAPVDPSMFPTWPTKSEEHHHRKAGGNSPKPPSGGKAYSSLLADDVGFHLSGIAAPGGGFALKF